jgi:hypothetical protein
MNEKTTRKFLKPLKGSGELLKAGQHVATVRYFLQGWQDFMRGEAETAQSAQLTGMDGEITLNQEDLPKVHPDQLVGHEFVLHSEKQVDYQISIYKLKDNNPASGRYSIRCKMPG